MLVLSRKAGQRIQIGDNVFLTVSAIKGNRVTLGIDAPHDVAVRRAELIPLIPQRRHKPAAHDEGDKQVA